MRKQMATECATGKKTRCDGMRSVTDAYDAKLGVADAKVDRLRPRPVAPGKARALADALQTLGAVASADAAEKVLRTLLPLVFALVLEGSAGAFFLVAFPPIVPAPPANENRPAAANDREEAAPTPEPKPRKRKPVPAADTDGKVVAAEVLALLRSKRQPMTNDEIATALGRHKGTVSKARKALGRQVRTQREGRKVYATAG